MKWNLSPRKKRNQVENFKLKLFLFFFVLFRSSTFFFGRKRVNEWAGKGKDKVWMMFQYNRTKISHVLLGKWRKKNFYPKGFFHSLHLHLLLVHKSFSIVYFYYLLFMLTFHPHYNVTLNNINSNISEKKENLVVSHPHHQQQHLHLLPSSFSLYIHSHTVFFYIFFIICISFPFHHKYFDDLTVTKNKKKKERKIVHQNNRKREREREREKL